jgi:hypothetical protein
VPRPGLCDGLVGAGSGSRDLGLLAARRRRSNRRDAGRERGDARGQRDLGWQQRRPCGAVRVAAPRAVTGSLTSPRQSGTGARSRSDRSCQTSRE